MAVTVENSGTQTATISTEHTLHTETEAKVLTLMVNTTNMAGGTTPDILELYVKAKVLSGGTEVVAYYASFMGVQGQPLKISIPIPSAHSAIFTLKQTQGTGRSYEWAVLSV
jgi:hypothetical protein